MDRRTGKGKKEEKAIGGGAFFYVIPFACKIFKINTLNSIHRFIQLLSEDTTMRTAGIAVPCLLLACVCVSWLPAAALVNEEGQGTDPGAQESTYDTVTDYGGMDDTTTHSGHMDDTVTHSGDSGAQNNMYDTVTHSGHMDDTTTHSGHMDDTVTHSGDSGAQNNMDGDQNMDGMLIGDGDQNMNGTKTGQENYPTADCSGVETCDEDKPCLYIDVSDESMSYCIHFDPTTKACGAGYERCDLFPDNPSLKHRCSEIREWVKANGTACEYPTGSNENTTCVGDDCMMNCCGSSGPTDTTTHPGSNSIASTTTGPGGDGSTRQGQNFPTDTTTHSGSNSIASTTDKESEGGKVAKDIKAVGDQMRECFEKNEANCEDIFADKFGMNGTTDEDKAVMREKVAGEAAVGKFQTCLKTKSKDVCMDESKGTYKSVGGVSNKPDFEIEREFKKSIEEAKTATIGSTLDACLGNSLTATTARRAECEKQAKANYTSLGGSADDYELERVNAVRKAVQMEVKACNEKGTKTREKCKQEGNKVYTKMEGTGKTDADFEKFAKAAASGAAADASRACATKKAEATLGTDYTREQLKEATMTVMEAGDCRGEIERAYQNGGGDTKIDPKAGVDIEFEMGKKVAGANAAGTAYKRCLAEEKHDMTYCKGEAEFELIMNGVDPEEIDAQLGRAREGAVGDVFESCMDRSNSTNSTECREEATKVHQTRAREDGRRKDVLLHEAAGRRPGQNGQGRRRLLHGRQGRAQSGGGRRERVLGRRAPGDGKAGT